MGQLHPAFKQADLVQGLDVWGKAGMHAENFALNDGSDAKVIEDVRAVLPRVCVAVFSDSFVVESVGGRNLSRFVIAAE